MWLNYIATLSLVNEFTGSSGLALSGVVLIRFLPSLVLAPVTGVVADRLNRVRILTAMALAAGLAAAGLAAVHRPSQAGLLYGLLALQFTCTAFYDPARKAMLPVVVPEADLHLATTIDSFAWSLTGAVGATLGGVAASRLGNRTCFLFDAATYAIAAWCAARVPLALGDPEAAAKQALHRSRSAAAPPGTPLELELAEAGGSGGGGADAPPCLGPQKGFSIYRKESDTAEIQLARDGGEDKEGAAAEARGDRRGLLEQGRQRLGGGAGLAAAAAAAWREGLRAFWEGWHYLCSPANQDVALVVTIKGFGSLTWGVRAVHAQRAWGAIDVTNVKYSEMPHMQTLGDPESTLGYLFGMASLRMVGLGCFVGPILMNLVVPPRPRPLLWGCVASFFFLLAGCVNRGAGVASVFVGYVLMLVAPNIAVILLSTFVRSIGSASLWIYSALLLQLRVPNDILGRTSAVEMALYTVAESWSSLATGAAYDALGASVRAVCVALVVAQAGICAAWVAIAMRGKAGGGREASEQQQRQHKGGYAAVPSSDREPDG
eukprot:scaffold5.g832.t1